MLSLFKDQEQPLSGDLAVFRANEILASFLNKGIVPSWETYFQELPVMSEAENLEKIKTRFHLLTEWTFLEDILAKEGTEFFFHAPESCQRLTLNGSREGFAIDLIPEEWQVWLEIISLKFRQNWNVQQPFTSFYGNYKGKSYRWTLIHGATSPDGKSKLVLRSLSQRPFGLQEFGETAQLKNLVHTKKNLLIAGSTGSGKTSLLSTLISLVPEEEHIVILEDTFEITNIRKHQTRFLAGSTPETSLKAFLTYSLRLSPDRIMLGEMRSHEVVPFLMAMNTGHKGLMGTIHAASAVDSLNRLSLLFSLYGGDANLDFEKVMELICRNLEYVVFMENKKVKEIIRILGCDKGVPFYENIIGEKPFSF